MGSDRYREVTARAKVVRELLLRLDAHSLRQKPNSYEPTAAETLAQALLELDRIASEARIEPATLPAFAGDFLNRRLSKRLLQRYHGGALPAEFRRRLDDVLERLAPDRLAGRSRPAIERVHRLLAQIESALLLRQAAADWSPGTED